jgi:hypothetical protein
MATTMFTNPYDAQLSADSARRKEMRDVAKMDAYDYHAYQAGLSSQDASRALGGMMGMQTPEEAKQAKIEEIMGQYGEGAKSYEQLLEIADSFRDAGMLDLWEQTMGMAKDKKGTTSDQYLTNKRLRNEKALAIQQAFGPADSIEKKQELHNKLISLGYGDSTITTGLSSDITTLKAAGFKITKEERIKEDADEAQRVTREKEARIAKKQAQDIAYKSVTNFNKGQADAAYYFSANEPEGFGDEDKKALIGKVGLEISNYDNILSTEATRGKVTPAIAAGYYTKVLDLPNVYTADPEFKFGDTATWGTDAAFSSTNFTDALDTVFNRGGAVVKAQDVAMYSKLGLIIPMITQVTINGKVGVLTPATVEKLRLKYSK